MAVNPWVGGGHGGGHIGCVKAYPRARRPRLCVRARNARPWRTRAAARVAATTDLRCRLHL